jgi:hypothetical protein
VEVAALEFSSAGWEEKLGDGEELVVVERGRGLGAGAWAGRARSRNMACRRAWLPVSRLPNTAFCLARLAAMAGAAAGATEAWAAWMAASQLLRSSTLAGWGV